MPFLQLNSAKYYYEDEGEGPVTLLFGHSLLFSLRMFDDQVDHFKDRFRCVRYDFRGQGRTEVTEDGYDLDTLTGDTVELILKLGIAPCIYVGFSMGGMIAMRLAARHPELVRALVLIDTSSEPEPRIHMPRNQLLAWVARYLGLGLVAGRIMSMFFGPAFKTDPARKIQRKQWRNYFLDNDRIGVSRAVNGVLYRSGITEELDRIKVPTLILVGSEDELTDRSRADIMHQHIKGSELHVVERAAHMGPVEEPEQVNGFMDRFLEQQAGLQEMH